MSLGKRGKSRPCLYNGHGLGGINRSGGKGDIFDLVCRACGLHTGNTTLDPDTVFKFNDYPFWIFSGRNPGIYNVFTGKI